MKTYPRTPTGEAAARARWELLGGWMVDTGREYLVTDDEVEAVRAVAVVAGTVERACLVVQSEVLQDCDAPVVDRAFVEAMCGPGPSPRAQLATNQLGLFQPSATPEA